MAVRLFVVFYCFVFWDHIFIARGQEDLNHNQRQGSNITRDVTTEILTVTPGPHGFLVHRFVGYGPRKTTTPERPPPDVAITQPMSSSQPLANSTPPCGAQDIACSYPTSQTMAINESESTNTLPTSDSLTLTTKLLRNESAGDNNINGTTPAEDTDENVQDITKDQNFVAKLVGIIVGIIVVTVLIVVGVTAILKQRKRSKERKESVPPPPGSFDNPVNFTDDTKI